MKSVRFHLFRSKIVETGQGELFPVPFDRQQLLLDMISNIKPWTPRGSQWSVGGLTFFSDVALGAFSLGRKSRTKLPLQDDQSKEYFTEVLEISPFTQVVFDAKRGLFAIAVDPSVARNVDHTADVLARMLERAMPAQRPRFKIRVKLDPMYDPRNFIERLRSATEVLSFTTILGPPNPYDAHSLYQKPLQEMCRDLSAKQIETTVSGADMRTETLVEVTEAVAATANDALARIRRRGNRRPTTIKLHTNPAMLSYETADGTVEAQRVVADAQAEHDRIRNLGNGRN